MTGTGFWSMGGYARYVWPCFAFAAVVLGWNLWSARQYRMTAQSRARRALAAAASDAAAEPAAATAPAATAPAATAATAAVKS